MIPGSGISHIEFWVSDLEKSLEFYAPLFAILGWNRLAENSFSDGLVKIYFRQNGVVLTNSVGPRHICFRAENCETVDDVGSYLRKTAVKIIRGPMNVEEYSSGYYTVDFRDPDNYILEVSYAPNSKR